MVANVLGFVVKLIDMFPIMKGYRTATLLFIQAVLAVLDIFGIGGGNLWITGAPFLAPLTTVTALAHGYTKTNN